MKINPYRFKRKFILLLSILSFFFIVNINSLHYIHNLQPVNLEVFHSSDNYYINPIYINDDDPDFNWSKTAAENDWCSGSGSWSDPYIIEDIIINGNSVSNCIEIYNSSKYFIITNCTVYNSSSGHDYAGIFLENVNNSLIFENNCSDNKGHGIRLINAYNNTLQNNFIQNNVWDGILIRISANNKVKNNSILNNDRGIRMDQYPVGGLGINNTFTNNSIHDNSGTGIVVSDNYYAKIINNSVYNNSGGIKTSCSNSTIRGNFIHSQGDYMAGLSVGGSNCIVENNTIWDNDIGISLGGSDNIITNNYLYSNDEGILISYTNNSKIIDNRIINCSIFQGITYRSNNLNLTMKRNNLTDAIFYLACVTNELDTVSTHIIDKSNLVNEKPVYFYVNKIGLRSNNFSDPGQIILFNCNNSLLSNLNGLEGGITLAYSYNNTLSNNSIHAFNFGIWLYNSEDNILFNNQISLQAVQFLSFAITKGIFLEYSGYCNISENSITGFGYGIHLQFDSNYNNLTHNVIYQTLAGTVIQFCSKNDLYQNVINQTIIGIWFSGHAVHPCVYNRVTNNDIINNDGYGIYMESSSNNTVVGNNINYNNITGLLLSPNSDDNLIYNNTFEGNVLNAQDDAINNQWDNGMIGNYWDDYTGYDLNEDGIGDIPYNITGSAASKDRFPLLRLSLVIVIENPHSNELFGFTPPEITLTITSLNIDTIWYSLSNETFSSINYTFTGFIEQNTWNSFGNGSINISFYANNSYGFIGSSEVIVRKDIISPQILIYSPIEDQEFAFNAPSFNLNISEPNLDSIWYTIDNIESNFTITQLTGTINQDAWDAISDGNIKIIFYAKDLAGNIGNAEVVIKKNTQVPEIPGYNLFFLLGIFSVVAILISKRAKISKI